MSEITVKRICKPGWKNCKMPELRQRIAELAAEKKELTTMLELPHNVMRVKKYIEMCDEYLTRANTLQTKLDAVNEMMFKKEKWGIKKYQLGCVHGWNAFYDELRKVIGEQEQGNDDG